MPIFDFLCIACGDTSEILVTGIDDDLKCNSCGSKKLEKQLSPHSSMSGTMNNSRPGPEDTTCCGSSPDEAKGCAGPGSCCGKI